MIYDDMESYLLAKRYVNKVIKDLGAGSGESKEEMFTDPKFTGIPTAPTAVNGTNTEQLATTEFVINETKNKIDKSDLIEFQDVAPDKLTSDAVTLAYNNGIFISSGPVFDSWNPCFLDSSIQDFYFTNDESTTWIVLGGNINKWVGMVLQAGNDEWSTNNRGAVYEFTKSTNTTFSYIKRLSENLNLATLPTLGTDFHVYAINSRYIHIDYKLNGDYVNWITIDKTTLSSTLFSSGFIYGFAFDTSCGTKASGNLVKDLRIKSDFTIEVFSKSPWEGKKANFLGDSITYGINTTKVYHQYLQENLELAIARNYGINGSTIADGSIPMYSRVTSMDNDADLICVFGGTNDFNANTPIGNTYSTATGKRVLNKDTSTFKGALNTMFSSLVSKYSSKTIVMFTPLHRETLGVQPTEYDPNTIGLYIDQYVDAIKEIAAIWSIPVADLWNNSGLQPNNAQQKSLYFHSDDGLHPNAIGHQKIAIYLEGFLNSLIK